MANKKNNYKNAERKRIRNKAKREGITPQEVIENANKLEQERRNEKKIKLREKEQINFEQKVEEINNRPKISLEDNARQLIENEDLDRLNDELIKETELDLKVEERWDERQVEIDRLNEEGLERWKSQKKERLHNTTEQEYNDWIHSQDYIDQSAEINKKLRDQNIHQQQEKQYEKVWDDLDKKNEGNIKWEEAEKNRNKSYAEKHFKDNIETEQKNSKINKVWDDRSLEKEYQNIKNRLDYEYNKPVYGPMTEDIANLQQDFKDIKEARDQMNRYNDYDERVKDWRKNNPEEAVKLDAKREARKSGQNTVNETAEKVVNEQMQKEIAEDASKNLKKSTMKNLGHVMNAGFAIMDYKDSREAGHSVGKSVVKAGAEFAKGELLGGWYMAAMLAKSAPTIAVSAIEGLNTMSRTMNSMQRRQLFGESQFMDTQQLATMRQSGMELAKMSQYNLQQSLMGNEAEHLHRL